MDINNEHCPHCFKSLQGKPIPPENQASYGYSTHYSEVVAIYDRDSDRTVAWKCPYCKGEWKRDL